jgi:hypothetical protein
MEFYLFNTLNTTYPPLSALMLKHKLDLPTKNNKCRSNKQHLIKSQSSSTINPRVNYELSPDEMPTCSKRTCMLIFYSGSVIKFNSNTNTISNINS